MQKPYEYFVLWRNKKGEVKQFNTNIEHAALMMEIRMNGTAYIDTRYAARLRLYNYLRNKQFLAA